MFCVHAKNVQAIQNVYKRESNQICSCWCMFYVHKTSTLSTFWIFATITTPSSVIFCNFVKIQDQSFHNQKDSLINSHNFNNFYFFKMCFFDILFIKIQVIFINFPIPYFLAKKSGKIYFFEQSQQHINLRHRLTFGLPQHTIFSAADWNSNT